MSILDQEAAISTAEGTAIGHTYLNPVYRRNFPDPFILKHCGEYWAYCTGPWDDGRYFGVLHSRDLIHWREVAGALAPLPGSATCYWAPEVIYDNGRFFMYYSVGDEEHMHIRVAVARRPAGPFVDSGRRLTSESFAIDAHVFEDDDGSRYLFYATDFLNRDRVGTGTVRDRLLDPLTLAGRPQPVTLPGYDWQIYDPRRVEKGGVCWHTIEGSFVLKHKGRYYQMFSGGNWRNPSYGVSYATTDNINSQQEWEQVDDGEHVLPILGTVPGKVIGPGHNSVVRGPDNRQLFCVYHRWPEDQSGRHLALDRLEWAGERLLVLGPSHEPQPVPLLPTFADYFDGQRLDGLGSAWTCRGGRWAVVGGEAVQEATDDVAEARCLISAPCFVAEVSLRAVATGDQEAAYGILLTGEEGALLRFRLRPQQNHAAISWRAAAGWREQKIALPAGFETAVYHLLRFEINQQLATISLDGPRLTWAGQVVANGPYQAALSTESMAAAFAGFALTIGWQDSFVQDGPAAELGWQAGGAGAGFAGNWHVQDQQLWHRAEQGRGDLTRGPLPGAYELIVNARLASAAGDVAYGFYPALREDGSGPLLTIERNGERWSLVWREQETTEQFALPETFDPAVYQHFRFRKEGDRLALQWGAQVLGEGQAPYQPARMGLYAANAVVAFDQVRVTAVRVDSGQ